MTTLHPALKAIRFAKYADGIVAIIAFCVAGFFAFQHRYLSASLWAVSAIISAACYRWPPSQWLARKFMVKQKTN